MNKLIKLSDTHYIVVDDFEIKESDWCIINNKYIHQNIENDEDYLKNHCRKITHSTQPLNQQCQNACSGFCINCPDTSVKRLDLSEVEEAINGYSVEKMAEEYSYFERKSKWGDIVKNAYKKGFKAHQELVKDKLFTIDDVKKILYAHEIYEGNKYLASDVFDEVINCFLPKTEWDIEFDENGKIKLV